MPVIDDETAQGGCPYIVLTLDHNLRQYSTGVLHIVDYSLMWTDPISFSVHYFHALRQSKVV